MATGGRDLRYRAFVVAYRSEPVRSLNEPHMAAGATVVALHVRIPQRGTDGRAPALRADVLCTAEWMRGGRQVRHYGPVEREDSGWPSPRLSGKSLRDCAY